MHKVSVEQRAHDLAMLQIQLSNSDSATDSKTLSEEYINNYVYIHKHIRESIAKIEDKKNG